MSTHFMEPKGRHKVLCELIPTPKDVGDEVCNLYYATPSFDTY